MSHVATLGQQAGHALSLLGGNLEVFLHRFLIEQREFATAAKHAGAVIDGKEGTLEIGPRRLVRDELLLKLPGPIERGQGVRAGAKLVQNRSHAQMPRRQLGLKRRVIVALLDEVLVVGEGGFEELAAKPLQVRLVGQLFLAQVREEIDGGAGVPKAGLSPGTLGGLGLERLPRSVLLRRQGRERFLRLPLLAGDQRRADREADRRQDEEHGGGRHQPAMAAGPLRQPLARRRPAGLDRPMLQKAAQVVRQLLAPCRNAAPAPWPSP